MIPTRAAMRVLLCLSSNSVTCLQTIVVNLLLVIHHKYITRICFLFPNVAGGKHIMFFFFFYIVRVLLYCVVVVFYMLYCQAATAAGHTHTS